MHGPLLSSSVRGKNSEEWIDSCRQDPKHTPLARIISISQD